MHRLWQTIPVLLVTALFVSLALVTLPIPAAHAQGCPELITNGGFETTGGWEFGASPAPPQIVTITASSGTHSLRLGITSGGNIQSFSSARQTVSIPTDVTPATLSFWVYTIAEQPSTNDTMELAFLSPDGSVILAKPWQSAANNPTWTQVAFDLSAWQGQTIQLYFNVYNDGAGGRMGMYLDDVSLTACPLAGAATATPALTASPPPATPTPVGPTATATATRTPLPLPPTWTPVVHPPPVGPTTMPPQAIPAGCTEFTQNGGFEAGLTGWVAGVGPLPPAIVASPVLSGVYAARLGSQEQIARSYSSIRQTVTVPAGFAQTLVSFWTYTWSDVSSSVPSNNSQQFVLMGPGDVVWATPWRVLENSRAWQRHIFELLSVAGQTFDLYFAVINDGAAGRTALYLDEVHLWSCSAAASATASQAQVAPEARAVATMPEAQPTSEALAAVQPQPTWTPQPALIEPPGATAALSVAIPLPAWTEVAIATAVSISQPVGTPAVGAGALATVVPELETPTGAITQTGTATPGATISLTPQPASFLTNITSRWPRNWPFILIGILAIAVIVVLIIHALSNRTASWPLVLLGILTVLLIIFFITRTRPSP